MFYLASDLFINKERLSGQYFVIETDLLTEDDIIFDIKCIKYSLKLCRDLYDIRYRKFDLENLQYIEEKFAGKYEILEILG